MEHALDTAFLQSCYRQQKPVYEKLNQPVPVFSVYMPAWPGPAGKMIYYKDVYRLLRK
jgi:murein L,D-transpeptidase YcbB/YkuD